MQMCAFIPQFVTANPSTDLPQQGVGHTNTLLPPLQILSNARVSDEVVGRKAALGIPDLDEGQEGKGEGGLASAAWRHFAGRQWVTWMHSPVRFTFCCLVIR